MRNGGGGVRCLVGGFCRYPTPGEEMLDSMGMPETCESKYFEGHLTFCNMPDRDISSVADTERRLIATPHQNIVDLTYTPTS